MPPWFQDNVGYQKTRLTLGNILNRVSSCIMDFCVIKISKIRWKFHKNCNLLIAPPGGQLLVIEVVRGMILIGFAFCFTKFYLLVQKLWPNYIFSYSEEQWNSKTLKLGYLLNQSVESGETKSKTNQYHPPDNFYYQ